MSRKSSHEIVTEPADRTDTATPDSQQERQSPRTERISALLDQSHVVYSEKDDTAFVTINNTVILQDVHSRQRRVCTPVSPGLSGLVPGGVSVLSPLGSSLIGCREGDVVLCPERDRRRSLRVVAIQD